MLASPTRARDRFLLALLAETGMRIGQALGLRHADFVSRGQRGAHRAPSGEHGTELEPSFVPRRRCR